MYIVVLDYDRQAVDRLAWDVGSATRAEIEIMLEAFGYSLPDINWMATEEEPEYRLVEVSDHIPNIKIERYGKPNDK